MEGIMTEKEGLIWFKTQFRVPVQAAVAGTPFTVDLISAIAMQESYSDAWGLIYKTMPVAEVLKRCVGDSLDFPSRSSAFPKNKAALIAASVPNGQQMFDIARDALIMLAGFNHGYNGAAHNPDKFCHGYGIFQYDIQFFRKTNPDFFLQKKWFDLDQCLALCLTELKGVADSLYAGKTSLTDEQLTYVAIGYNIGASKVKVGAGFKQGHQSDGIYYGENIDRYMRMSEAIP
jgi:hypothetical protein